MKRLLRMLSEAFRLPVDAARHVVSAALLVLVVLLVGRFFLQLSEPTDVPLARTLRALDPVLARAGRLVGVRWPVRGGVSPWPLFPALVVWVARTLIAHHLERVSRRLHLGQSARDLARATPRGHRSSAAAHAAGAALGRFTVVRERAHGPRGPLYLARDTTSGERVAVRVAPIPLDEARRAADATGRLAHPSIVPVREVAPDGSGALVVSEWVEAPDLAQLLSDGPRLSRAAALLVGAQVASALAHAHAGGVLHGNLVTSNVLVTPEGRARVTDFACPRDGVSAEAASDVAALGALLGVLEPQPTAALQAIVESCGRPGTSAAQVAADLQALAAAPLAR
jgi:tRNA A-37 threonylcarbamoyl transferase component Bud32